MNQVILPDLLLIAGFLRHSIRPRIPYHFSTFSTHSSITRFPAARQPLGHYLNQCYQMEHSGLTSPQSLAISTQYRSDMWGLNSTRSFLWLFPEQNKPLSTRQPSFCFIMSFFALILALPPSRRPIITSFGFVSRREHMGRRPTSSTDQFITSLQVLTKRQPRAPISIYARRSPARHI
jgi:hypothetical protein